MGSCRGVRRVGLLRYVRSCFTAPMLALFPHGPRSRAGRLTVGGLLGERAGGGVRHAARRLRRADAAGARAARPPAAGDALVVYGTKAFPNVALLRLFAEEGLGADVSTLGELAFAQAAGLAGDRLVVHGNNKSDEELRSAAEVGALVVLDSPRRAGTRRRGRRRAHRSSASPRASRPRRTRQSAPATSARSSASLPSRRSRRSCARARPGLTVEGLHAHVGSQLADVGAHLLAVDRLADLAAALRPRSCGWTPAVVDVGGGLGVRRLSRRARAARSSEFVRACSRRCSGTGGRPGCLAAPDPRAGPLARRAGGVHALRSARSSARPTLVRRGRRRHLRQPAAAALRRRVHGAARQPRRRGERPATSPSPASTASRATC